MSAPSPIRRHLLLVAVLALAGGGSSPAAETNGLAAAAPLLMGGVGGVYFLAEPGELVVEVEKRDRRPRDNRTELRAILAGPDRRVVQEATIPDDGQRRGSGLGPAQRGRLSAHVERQGVYVLTITVSNDRWGEQAVWGFRSNCPKYLIETARGHRDARHEEPIVLASPGQPADVCFLPRTGPFRIEVTGLPGSAGPLQVFDGSGAALATLAVSTNGAAAHAFTADVPRDAVPWRLHVPSAQATVAIDGVTRWDTSDRQPNLACWTPEQQSWFPLLDNRWLLTPYRQLIHGPPGQQREIAFQIRNDARRERTIQLGLEFPDGAWPAHLSAERVTLGRNKATTVTVVCTVPDAGQTRVGHLRARPLDEAGFSTYSTLTVQAGEAPATKPLAMPIVLKPYEHENEQFGQAPDFPVENEIYFDRRNRPSILTGNAVATLRDGQWTTTKLTRAAGLLSTKIAYDRDNGLYALANDGRTATLFHSTDGGRTFTAWALPGRDSQSRTFDIEQFSGHNVPAGPPPILRYTRTVKDEKLFWRSLHDLELFLPKKIAGRLVIGEPVLISTRCIGLTAHSGIPASVVSRGSKVHVAWGEATDPKDPGPGVPAYVATYDRETGELSKPALVGYGGPPNDLHNSPSITIDSQGYLHVLGGTHAQPFPYARSLQPNDAGAGWTEAVPVGEDLRQTYIGLVCGPDDTLHSVSRLWRPGADPFPASIHATLAYQRKRAGQPWEPPRILVVPPLSEYSVYYHRLTIDRRGRLFISYDYWSTFWFYRNDHPGRRRTVLMSSDSGNTWKLAETTDLK